jgi:hypothetical protein
MTSYYTKRLGGNDDWQIYNEEGELLATTDTELLADVLMEWLINYSIRTSSKRLPPKFTAGRPYPEKKKAEIA